MSTQNITEKTEIVDENLDIRLKIAFIPCRGLKLTLVKRFDQTKTANHRRISTLPKQMKI